MSDHPDRLFWYVSGTLDEHESVQVEAHLRGCAECRELADTLGEWKTTVLRQREGGGHPGPEELDAYLMPVAGGRPPDIEAHLERCAACRDDLEALRRIGAQAPAPARTPDVPRPMRSRRAGAIPPWAVAAFLAALLVAPLAWFWMRQPDKDVVLLPALRSASSGPLLAGQGPWRVILVPPSEAVPGLYTLRVEYADGRPAAAMDPLDLQDGKGGVPISVPALPGPAAYRLVIAPSQDPAAAYDYPFRVESAGGD
jgi:hypothetical protein